jgi:hypothetical protein
MRQIIVFECFCLAVAQSDRRGRHNREHNRSRTKVGFSFRGEAVLGGQTPMASRQKCKQCMLGSFLLPPKYRGQVVYHTKVAFNFGLPDSCTTFTTDQPPATPVQPLVEPVPP